MQLTLASSTVMSIDKPFCSVFIAQQFTQLKCTIFFALIDGRFCHTRRVSSGLHLFVPLFGRINRVG